MNVPDASGKVQRRPARFRLAVAGVIVFLAAVGLYWPAVGHEFVWDDLSILMAHESLDDWSQLGSNLAPGFFHEASSAELRDYWRPVVVLSHMIDREFFGDAAWGPHLVNMLLHAATSVLVLLLSQVWFRSTRVSFVAGLAFAVHPVHVEVVAWVSGRSDLLLGLFMALALLADANHGRTGRTRWLAISLASFALALLSKEAAVVFPALVAGRALLAPADCGPGERRPGRAVLPIATSLAVLVFLVWIRFGVLDAAAPVGLAATVDRWSLFRTWWSALWLYFELLAWPARLTILHSLDMVRGAWSPPALAGVLAFLLLAWAGWHARRRVPGLAFAILILLVTLAPLSNVLVPVSHQGGAEFPVAERFLYLPSIGFSLLAAWWLALWLPNLARGSAGPAGTGPQPGRNRARRPLEGLALLLALLLLVAAGVRTAVRLPDWESDLTLFAAAVRDSPGSYLAHLNYASARVAAATESADPGARATMLEDARRHYLEAARLAPDSYRVHYDLGNLYRYLGQGAEAAAAYRRALELDSGLYQARINLGAVLAEQGDLEGALDAFEAAGRIGPDLVAPKVNRAHVLQMLGRPEEAITLYEAALALDPDLFAARDGLKRARATADDPQ